MGKMSKWKTKVSAKEEAAVRKAMKEQEKNQGNFREVPTGTYPVVVDKMEVGQSNWGDDQINITFKITEGEYRNSRIFYNGTFDEHFAHGINKTAELLAGLLDDEDMSTETIAVILGHGVDEATDFIADCAEMVENFGYDLDYEDWRDDLEAEYPELTEDQRIALMYEINGDYLDDERVNLNIQLSQPILVIGDLGLWYGRRSGYKEIESGNIRDCLYADTDYSTWYVDRLGDLRCDAIHHDGTDHYLYRAYKDGVRESQIDLLKDKLYRGIATRADVTRITRRLGDDIARVYGFSIPRARQTPVMER